MTNKTITLPHCRAHVVEIANTAEVYYNKMDNKLEVSHTFTDYSYEVQLPSGQWQLIGVWPEITEEQAAMVVREYGIGMFLNYNNKSGHKMFALFGTAIESLRSLLTANNLDPDKRWAVLIDKK